MIDCSSVDTPSVENGPESRIVDADMPVSVAEKEQAAMWPIRSVVGCCWWLVAISRADITNAVHRISAWQDRPSQKLWRWCLHLLRFLKGSREDAMVYRRTDDAVLRACADASFAMASASDPAARSKSTLGTAVFYRGCLVSWATHFSTRVLTSSSKAECSAVVFVLRELTALRQFLDQLLGSEALKGVCVPIWEDNKSAVNISAASAILKRSKHFEVEWDKLRECVAQGEVVLVQVSTEGQPADLLANPVGVKMFRKLRLMLMGC